jgi:tRNA1(Val) A37 N6-methylase TrmN6
MFDINEGERLDEVNESLKLIQKKDGLTFGTDAYLLAAYMYRHNGGTAVELGGGTGIISLLAASKNRFDKIKVVEIQKDYAELIERNIKLNGMDDRLEVICKDVRDLKPDDVGKEAEVVFSNPPYMKTESGKANESEGKYIARHEVFGTINDFCAAAYRLLKFGGNFYVVYRPDRLIDLIDALRQNRLEPKKMTFVQSDTATAPSMVLIEAKKGASPSLTLTKNLLIYKDGTREMSDDAKRIYENCSFEEFFRK